jgi:hypothetical protein
MPIPLSQVRGYPNAVFTTREQASHLREAINRFLNAEFKPRPLSQVRGYPNAAFSGKSPRKSRYLYKNTRINMAYRRQGRGDKADGHLFISNFVKTTRINLVNKMPLF